MSSHRATRDELLAAADPAGTLGPVVRAATAPAHDDELAGEGAALAAFRAAATTPRPSRFRAVVTRLLTVKAVVAVSVAGSAGIVLAATGSLPSPWSEPTPPPVTTPAPNPSSTGVERRVEDVDPRKPQPGKPAAPPRHDSEPGRSGEKPGRSDESARPDRPGKQDKPTKPAKPGKPSDKDEDHDEDEEDGGNEDQENQRPAPDPGEPTHLRPGSGRPHAPGNPPSGAAPTVPPSGVTPPSPGG